MRPLRGILALSLASTVAGTLAYGVAAGQPPAASTPALETLTGTVCRLDFRAGTLDLLTGVGHAIRIRRVRLAADIAVAGRGAEAGIAALVPGSVCRLECRVEPAGATATRVELLQPAPVRTP